MLTLTITLGCTRGALNVVYSDVARELLSSTLVCNLYSPLH